MNLRGPKVRISRQLGISLTPKAQKHLDRRPGTPGQHGLNQRPGKMSNYKRQLMEKQRLRAQYNVGERQLRNYFEEASRRGGNVGAALLQLLETRIDAMVLRAGYARTIFAARQLVVHGHVKLNGRRVSFPSHAVIPGDQVALTEKARAIPQVVLAMDSTRAPSYLELAGDGARLRELPEATQIPVTCQLPLVVEFYSR